MKKLLLETSFSKIYMIIMVIITLLILGGYFSYAMFTVTKEKENAISIVTGNLTYKLLVDDKETNTLTVPSNTVKYFTLTLSNPNNRTARFNFYYVGELSLGVNAGYFESDGYNVTPESVGINLEKEGTSGSSNVYKIVVSNATNKEVIINLGVRVGLDYNDLSLPDNGHLFTKVNKEIATTLVKNKSNDESLAFEDATEEEKKEAWLYSHPATEQTDALVDYRYVGSDPNNYVLFNNELWRIIGSFTVDDGNGNLEERLKIVSDERLNGYYSWDNKDTTTGALTDKGKNDWSSARLNYLLNEGHEGEENGGSLYYNSGKGLCYSNQFNALVSCDFTKTGLKKLSKTMIDNALWYLGGTTQESNEVSDYYIYERSVEVYNGNPISWLGKVGLIYSSDYGYATSGGDSVTRNECLNMLIYNWRTNIECYENNWLHDNYVWHWTITASSKDSYSVFRVSKNGEVNFQVGAYDYIGVYPVVYLKKEVNIIFGNGSKENPYILYL